jgi:hypothetical protein
MKKLIGTSLIVLFASGSGLAQEGKTAPPCEFFPDGQLLRSDRKSLRSPKKTTPIGSRTDGKEFTALPKEPALLVGFAVKKGDWFGSTIISSLQPIYGTLKGTVRGRPWAGLLTSSRSSWRRNQATSSANSGERPEDHIHGIKVIFRKIDFLRQGVIATDTYESDWIGVELDGKSERVGRCRTAGGGADRARR